MFCSAVRQEESKGMDFVFLINGQYHILVWSSTPERVGEQTGEETAGSDLTELHLCDCCLQDRRCSSLQEGRACSGETQQYVNIVSTVCTGVCCQLYLANLQTGIRAEQLDIILFVMFPLFLSLL